MNISFGNNFQINLKNWVSKISIQLIKHSLHLKYLQHYIPIHQFKRRQLCNLSFHVIFTCQHTSLNYFLINFTRFDSWHFKPSNSKFSRTFAACKEREKKTNLILKASTHTFTIIYSKLINLQDLGENRTTNVYENPHDDDDDFIGNVPSRQPNAKKRWESSERNAGHPVGHGHVRLTAREEDSRGSGHQLRHSNLLKSHYKQP